MYTQLPKTPRKEIAMLLKSAKAQIPNLVSGEVFVLSDLFYGYQWNRIPVEDRKLLGRFFAEYAMSKACEGKLKLLDKSTNYKQRYVHV